MSAINRNMKQYKLQIKKETQSKSGQIKSEWVDLKDIDLAIYPASNVVMTSNNIRFNQSTNTGLTIEKNIKESDKKDGNRIVLKNKIDTTKNDETYEITFANPSGRLTQLFLKMVVI